MAAYTRFYFGQIQSHKAEITKIEKGIAGMRFIPIRKTSMNQVKVSLSFNKEKFSKIEDEFESNEVVAFHSD